MGDQMSVRCSVAAAVEREEAEQKPLPKGKAKSGKAKSGSEDSEESGEETTPTTTASDTDTGDIAATEELDGLTEEEAPAVPAPCQLGPGIYHDDDDDDDDEADSDAHASAHQGLPPPPAAAVASLPPPTQPPAPVQQPETAEDSEERGSSGVGEQSAAVVEAKFSKEETVFIFDWDDTVLPSTWVQRQGLRLDEGSAVSPWQREQLAEVATIAAETIRLAKQQGSVVFVTNAERGWIELSCQKFLPTLAPSLENVRLLSARTRYEGARNSSPLFWKLHAFEAEIARSYGGAENLVNPSRRKNVLSLGDSVHERDALFRATNSLPSCCAKSLKFAERPDLSQICKQHSLIISCLDRIVHHDGTLDLCIQCE